MTLPTSGVWAAAAIVAQRALRHEEDVLGQVFVAVLFETFALFDKLLMALVELVGDVLQEDET